MQKGQTMKKEIEESKLSEDIFYDILHKCKKNENPLTKTSIWSILVSIG